MYARGMLLTALLFTAAPAIPSRPAPRQLISKIAEEASARWPEADLTKASYAHPWSYDKGTLLQGFVAATEATGDSAYDTYVRAAVDQVVDAQGNIKDFPNEPHSSDQILMGRQLLHLYRETHEERYAKAARHVMDEVAQLPRNRAGGFWHKQIYPTQMWLDGLYMVEPFYAEYASTFHDSTAFVDIAHQFTLIENKTRDPKTGLLYHGWDESRQQPWADKQTGLSSQFWARAIGWYAMALVDTLAYFPANDPGREQLLQVLQRLAPALMAAQDSEKGVWWEVLNRPGAPGNFVEASASCMYVYALEKGVRLHYLPASDLAAARKGWAGILTQFVKTDSDGTVHLTGVVRGAGLGGTPYRSGTYEYYTTERIVSDDPKGIGAFLMAGSEEVRLEKQ